MMPTRTLLCQTVSKYYQIESDLTKCCQNYLLSSNLKIMPGGPPLAAPPFGKGVGCEALSSVFRGHGGPPGMILRFEDIIEF